MAMEGLGDAVSRYNEEPEKESPMEEQAPEGEEGGKGHTFHVHKHKNGKHHLTVEGDGGQMVHHSEHDSLEDAAEEMKGHGE